MALMGHRALRTDAPKVLIHPMDAPYPIEVVPVSEYVEHARGELEPLFEQARQEEMALRAAEDRGTSRVKKSSKAIRLQEARVQALLDAPGETDWDEYDQEIGILLHMLPDKDDYVVKVQQPDIPELRESLPPTPRFWSPVSAIMSLVGTVGILLCVITGHMQPELLVTFAAMIGMPALRMPDGATILLAVLSLSALSGVYALAKTQETHAEAVRSRAKAVCVRVNETRKLAHLYEQKAALTYHTRISPLDLADCSRF
jgi:hypothetical protein